MMITGSCENLKPVLFYYFVHAQLLFLQVLSNSKKQHKQTRDLSSSNRGRLLNIGFDVFKSKWIAWRLCYRLSVCVLCSCEFVNPLKVIIQGCLIQVLLKNGCFLKKVENHPIEMSIEPVVLHLVFLKRNWKRLKLVDLVVKPIQPIGSLFQLVDFWKSLTEFC